MARFVRHSVAAALLRALAGMASAAPAKRAIIMLIDPAAVIDDTDHCASSMTHGLHGCPGLRRAF